MLAMSPKKYIERMMFNYKKMFGDLPSMNVQSPLEHSDHPELDESELLDDEGVEKYQSLIGSQQWAILLGRFDIACAVQTMSSFRAAPRIGHLKSVKRITGYLRKFKEAKIRFRTHMPDFTDIQQTTCQWESIWTLGGTKTNKCTTTTWKACSAHPLC